MKDRLKSLWIIAPLIVSFVLSVIVVNLYRMDYERNVDMMFSQKIEMIDMLADGLEGGVSKYQDYDKQREFYESWLKADVERIDAQPHTLAVMYDPELKQVSNRVTEIGDDVYSARIVKPLEYPEVVKAVKEKERGNVQVASSEDDIIHYYFRWCPTGLGEQYLLVTGIHRNTIVKGKDTYLYVAVAVIVITVMSNSLLVMRRWR